MFFRAKIVQQGNHKNIRLNNPNLFYHSLRQIPEGKDVWVEVDERAPKRSEQQNRYYWFGIGLIADYSGHTPNEIHELCKKKFITAEYKHVLGNNLTMRSTTKLSKAEFVEYMENIRRWASQELHVIIPDPDADSAPLLNAELSTT